MATKPKTIAAQVKTLLTALLKTTNPDEVLRNLVASFVAPENPLSILLSVSTPAPVNGKWPYQKGQHGYLYNPDEMNAPFATTKGIRFGTGRYLISSAGISIKDGITARIVTRRMGVAPNNFTLHCLMAIGSDFRVMIDDMTKNIVVYYPDTAPGKTSSMKMEFGVIPFSSEFQTITVRLSQTTLTLTVDGVHHVRTIETTLNGPGELFTVGKDPYFGVIGATMEMQSVTVCGRYLTDEELSTLVA